MFRDRFAVCCHALLAFLGLTGCIGMHAQETGTPSSQDGSESGAAGGLAKRPLNIAVPASTATDRDHIATLHVYTNLMQVPVLVLNSDRGRLRPVPESKFRLSIDSGPLFKPTHVRREGDDPIELAILIDSSRPHRDLLPRLHEALTAVASQSLHEWDHISVYAADCVVIRSAFELSPKPELVGKAVDAALAPWQQRERQRHSPECKQALPLWDAAHLVIGQLRQLNGRRVLLVVSDGVDGGSRTMWSEVKHEAQVSSVAVFAMMTEEEKEEARPEGGLSPTPSIASSLAANTNDGGLGQLSSSRGSGANVGSPLDEICESSGGMETLVSPSRLSHALQNLLALIRERYILEYPRSNQATAGEHSLAVTIGDRFAYVRAAGISVPLADRKALENPLTLPSQQESPMEGPQPVPASPPK